MDADSTQLILWWQCDGTILAGIVPDMLGHSSVCVAWRCGLAYLNLSLSVPPLKRVASRARSRSPISPLSWRAPSLHPIKRLAIELLHPSTTSIMARGIEGNEISTPRPPTLKKSVSSSQSNKNQKSILGFFQKKAGGGGSPTTDSSFAPDSTAKTTVSSFKKASALPRDSASFTPAPSSDAAQPSSPVYDAEGVANGRDKENGLPSPVTSAGTVTDGNGPQEVAGAVGFSSPLKNVSAASSLCIL